MNDKNNSLLAQIIFDAKIKRNTTRITQTKYMIFTYRIETAAVAQFSSSTTLKILSSQKHNGNNIKCSQNYLCIIHSACTAVR